MNELKTITVTPYSSDLKDRHEELLPDFRRLLFESSDKSAWCLDVGCGRGRVSYEIVSKVRWVLGIDKSAKRIEEARSRAEIEGINNVQFIVGDVEELAYSDFAPTGSFQLITTNLCLSDNIIKRVFDALDSGGRFVGTCLEKHHWRETGVVSEYSYSEEQLLMKFKSFGLGLLHIDVVGSIIQFDDLKQVEKEYLPEHLVRLWQRNSRWQHLSTAFDSGEKTLTESKIVFSAYKLH